MTNPYETDALFLIQAIADVAHEQRRLEGQLVELAASDHARASDDAPAFRLTQDEADFEAERIMARNAEWFK